MIKIQNTHESINNNQMIKCNDISLSFGNKVLFEHFSFHVNKGEFVTIKGESGKGKTSLLKLLQGYVPMGNGEIEINNILLSQKHIVAIRNHIVWIPQNVNLPVKDGMQVIELLGVYNNLKVIKSYMVQLGLNSQMLNKDFQKISGGQKQRVIIAICLSIDKPIILMDEPTSSLDESSIQYLLQTIKGIKDRTVLTASHNITWIENSDRVIELK